MSEENENVEELNKIANWFNEKTESGQTRFKLLEDIINKSNNISNFKSTINEYEENLTSLKSETDNYLETSKNEFALELNSIISDTQTKSVKINEYYNQIKPTLDIAFEDATTINSTLKNNDSELDSCKAKWVSLDTDYKEIFDNYKSNFNEKILKTKNELDILIEEIKATEKKSKEILSLATGAGLSQTYGIKITKINNSIKKQEIIFIGINIIITCIATVFVVLNITGKIDITDIQGFVIKLLMFSSMSLPLIWIAKLNGRSLRENNHILEEYEHKKSLVDTYNGYKDTLIKLVETDEELSQKKYILELIESTTKGIMKNPADTLPKNKNEKMPLEDSLSSIINTLKSLEALPSSVISAFVTSLQKIVDEKENTPLQIKK